MKILRDLRVYNRGAKLPKGLINIIFYINVFYRISHFFSTIGLHAVGKIFWVINRLVFSVDIDPKARIGGGFEIFHGIGLVIGEFAIIGENFTVFQSVTIGGNWGKTRQHEGILLHQPLIGDNVTIGANSVVIGPILLHDGCQIGVCSVITKDVAPGTTVVGNNKVVYSKI